MVNNNSYILNRIIFIILFIIALSLLFFTVIGVKSSKVENILPIIAFVILFILMRALTNNLDKFTSSNKIKGPPQSFIFLYYVIWIIIIIVFLAVKYIYYSGAPHNTLFKLPSLYIIMSWVPWMFANFFEQGRFISFIKAKNPKENIPPGLPFFEFADLLRQVKYGIKLNAEYQSDNPIVKQYRKIRNQIYILAALIFLSTIIMFIIIFL